jgi:hypothetical protein
MKIVIDRDEDLATRGAKPSQRGVALPDIVRKSYGENARIGSRNLRQQRPARIGAVIVDENQLEASFKRHHDGDQPRVKPCQDRGRIVDWNHDRIDNRRGKTRIVVQICRRHEK